MKEDNYRSLISGLAYRCYARLDPWAQIKYSYEDLVQEGYHTLYGEALPRYDALCGTSKKTWVFTCVLSRFANIVKQENRFGPWREDYMEGYSEPQYNTSYDQVISARRYNEVCEVYRCDNAAQRYTPEDEFVFRQAVRALIVVNKDFVDLVLGDYPCVWRARKKLLTMAVRTRARRNCEAWRNRRRVGLSITGGMIARFLGLKSLSELRETFYNVLQE